MKITRRTQLLVVALALCFTTMIGSTLAWFTDSVESKGNKIETGTLKLEVLYQDGNEWKDLEQNPAPLFNYNLWEPGYAVVKGIEIKNTGTLALKYKVNFELTAESTGNYKLEDVIDVYLFDQEPARSDFGASAKVGTLTDLLYKEDVDGTVHGKLAGGATTDKLYIGLKMREEADNNYQGLSVGNGFNLVIVATQDTVESDSFGNDYDAGAPFPGDPFVVSTAEELLAALAEATDGTVIDATDVEYHITTADHFNIPAGVTLKNATIFADYRGGNYVMFTEGKGDSVVFENCSFGNTTRTILLGGAANGPDKVVYNNCTFKGQVITNFVDNAAGVAEFNNCTFTKSSLGTYHYTEGMGGTHIFNNCTFDYTGVDQSSMGVLTCGQINVYSETEYSTEVILNSCTRINCGTRKYGPNSTLTIK